MYQAQYGMIDKGDIDQLPLLRKSGEPGIILS
jgi:hypothetical protein